MWKKGKENKKSPNYDTLLILMIILANDIPIM